jgi:hypothetical protein
MAEHIDIINHNITEFRYYDNSTRTLLNYENNTDILEYDENGFLVGPFDNDTEISIYFQDCNRFHHNGSYSAFFAELITKTDTEYIYSVRVSESIPNGDFLALGTVKIMYDSNKITHIYVNDVLNGLLHDRYGDLFDIDPSDYIHLLKK